MEPRLHARALHLPWSLVPSLTSDPSLVPSPSRGKISQRQPDTPSGCRLLPQLAMLVRLLPVASRGSDVMGMGRSAEGMGKGLCKGPPLLGRRPPKPTSPHLSSVTAIVTTSEGAPA